MSKTPHERIKRLLPMEFPVGFIAMTMVDWIPQLVMRPLHRGLYPPQLRLLHLCGDERCALPSQGVCQHGEHGTAQQWYEACNDCQAVLGYGLDFVLDE